MVKRFRAETAKQEIPGVSFIKIWVASKAFWSQKKVVFTRTGVLVHGMAKFDTLSC